MTAQKRKRPHLGRGLESLIGPITNMSTQTATVGPQIPNSKFPPDKELRDSVCYIPIVSIRPNPYQPRTTWDQEELGHLADSIRANGVIQPILVRPDGDGFEVIAGERRLRAAKMAGLDHIPALARTASDDELLELALVENIHRADLNPIDRAQAYRNFIETFGLTQTDAASRLGQDRSVVANYLRLLDLPQVLKQMLVDGKLTMGHARAILALPTEELRTRLANRALAGRLSVRQVEQLVKRALTADKSPAPTPEEKPANIRDLEMRLRDFLGTKVEIDMRKRGNRGRIIIEYYSLDDFDRLTEKMGVGNGEIV